MLPACELLICSGARLQLHLQTHHPVEIAQAAIKGLWAWKYQLLGLLCYRCAQPDVLFKTEKGTLLLHSCTRLTAAVGLLAVVWKSLTKFMVLLSDFILKRTTFLALTANVLNTEAVPISLIPREATHHDRGNISRVSGYQKCFFNPSFSS